jgi:DNA-binding transcriptional LysR family regulator
MGYEKNETTRVVEIAKLNSMSKAAVALFVTQPIISKAVRDLEAELGITILDSTNNLPVSRRKKS